MNIFIGSSTESSKSGLLLNVARIVEDCSFTPVRWNQTPSVFKPGKFTLEVLENLVCTENIEAAIFIYTADDKVWYRGKEVGAPRDNVIFEHGLFSGKLGRCNSIIVKSGEVELPSDLSGLTYIDFSNGNQVKAEMELRQWLNNLAQPINSTLHITNNTICLNNEEFVAIKTFRNLEAAKPYIVEKAKNAQDIKILANKGIEFFGSDSSVISLAEYEQFKNLKRLKVLLLSPESSWINRGLMALRKYESVDDFKSELESTHAIVEMGMKKFLKDRPLEKSGIKYHLEEPCFRFIMVDDTVFVSSYAENPSGQVRDLPVFEIQKSTGSLFGSLRKLFNGWWANKSEFGKTFKENLDIEISAGGLVYFVGKDSRIMIALVQREDGSWVLPKGHKKKKDSSLEETAVREVSEETGLNRNHLECIRLIDTYSHDETAKLYSVSKINYFYLVKYNSAEAKELHTDFEHLSAKWWDITEELPFMFYSYQKILIHEAIKAEFGVDVKMHAR